MARGISDLGGIQVESVEDGDSVLVAGRQYGVGCRYMDYVIGRRSVKARNHQKRAIESLWLWTLVFWGKGESRPLMTSQRRSLCPCKIKAFGMPETSW